MDKNKIMETLQLNGKDNKKKIVLIFIASLVAMAAAVYGIFHIKKSDKTEVKKVQKTKKQPKANAAKAKKVSASKKNARISAKRDDRNVKKETVQPSSATVVQKQAATVPQQVYVVHPLPEKKQESKARRFRRHMSAAIASVLVISLVGSGTMSYVQPTTVLAKGSFTGIGRIVEDHSNGDPYVILDIVPTVATYTATDPSLDFSTGTMGYLVSGQAPIVQDIKRYFTNNSNAFFTYKKRTDLINSVNGGTDAFPSVTYRESYGGVGGIYDVTASSGWIQMLSQVQGIGEDQKNDVRSGSISVPTGLFTGKALYVGDNEGNFIAINEGKWKDTKTKSLLDGFYSLNSVDGDYQVTFTPSADGSYVVGSEISLSSLGASGVSSIVYRKVDNGDGTFYYEPTGQTILDLIKGGSPKKDGSDSEHTVSGDWSSDDDYHWHACLVEDCSEEEHVKDKAEHTWIDGSDGTTLECSVCGKTIAKSSGDESGDNETCNHENTELRNCGDYHEVYCLNCESTLSQSDHSWGEDGKCACDAYNAEEDKTEHGQETTPPTNPDPDEKTDTDPDDEADAGAKIPDGDGNEEESTDGAQTAQPEDTTAESPNNINSDALDGARIPVISSRWMKLAAEDASADEDLLEDIVTEGQSEELADPETEYGDGFYTSDEIDWDNIDWDALEAAGYYIVTFRALNADEIPASGETLYDLAGEPQPLSSAEGVFDAYDFVPPEIPQIRTLSMDFPKFGEIANADGAFLYVGDGEGDWKLERVVDNNTVEGADGIYVGTIAVYNAPVYFQCSSTGHDWLKQYVFSTLSDGDNPNSNFEIEVRTVLASEVTAGDIQEADLVFLESGQNNALLTSVTTKYIIGSDAGGADMSDEAVRTVLQRATEDYMPVIVDYDTTKEEKYKDSNYQLLARTMLKRDLMEFYSAVDVNDALIDNIYNGLGDDAYPDKSDNNYNYVNQNVYIVNDSSALVSTDFADPFDSDKARAGFSDVLSMIRAENTMRSEDDQIPESVSKAMAMQYIINFSVGIVGELSDLTILELQPTANVGSDLRTELDSKGNTKLILQTEKMTSGSQILVSKNSFSINSTVKSVAEFNGEWEDINGKYDFVFIGLDGRRLNLGDDKDRTARYNNSDLDGKVYHTGDSSNTGLGNYDANDITAQKMTALLEYMAAGYPVLVENDCFKNGSAQDVTSEDINTKYIDENSVMCNFLKAAISDERYKNRIYTVSDARIGSMFMMQLKISRPRISLVAEDGSEAPTTLTLEKDENGEYHGQLAYAVRDSRGSDYEYMGDWVVRVYADYDYDGVFEPEEEVTEYVNENGVIDVTVTDMGPGILPWKLEVSDYANEFRRDSVQGYFRIGSSTKGELKVLQITEKADDTAVNLQTMFNTNADSLLANYLRGAEATLNSEMQFETVNATELLIKLAENAKYLEQWDVVVLNLEGLDGVDSTITTAVTDYANAGRSLLVCGSMDSGTSRAGLSADLLGQTDSSTYVWLGANGASGYQRYKGLDSGMYYGNTELLAQSVNDGSISHYPYEISGDSFTVGAGESLRASAYLLDFSNNLKTDAYTTYVTPWYTFGGSTETAYGVSPRDARNNYYCYSKGNVVYLAQSRYPYVKDGGVGDDESKFFVNALIAAYSAGVHNANVRIVAGFAEDSADVESIAVPFDEIWLEAADSTRGILDNTVDVYFKFRDNNIAKSKSVIVGFYYENPNSSDLVDVGGELVKASPFATPVWTVTNNRLTLVEDGTLEAGKVYRIQAPVITLRENESETKADIYIVIETTFERGGKAYDVISSDSVSLNRAQLFLLE